MISCFDPKAFVPKEGIPFNKKLIRVAESCTLLRRNHPDHQNPRNEPNATNRRAIHSLRSLYPVRFERKDESTPKKPDKSVHRLYRGGDEALLKGARTNPTSADQTTPPLAGIRREVAKLLPARS